LIRKFSFSISFHSFFAFIFNRVHDCNKSFSWRLIFFWQKKNKNVLMLSFDKYNSIKDIDVNITIWCHRSIQYCESCKIEVTKLFSLFPYYHQ
jgi:hypothetical protein